MSYRKRVRIRYVDEILLCSIYEADELNTDAQEDPEQPTVRCPECSTLLNLGYCWLTVVQYGLRDEYDDALMFYHCSSCDKKFALHVTRQAK